MKARNTAKFHIMTALLVVVFSLIMALGVVYAKYVKSVEFSGNVTISADLAEKIELFEHKAVRAKDNNGIEGGYTLDNTKEVTTNDYILMPGVNVPKDPTIRIKGKTAIDAYLYVEIVNGLGSNGVSYTPAEHWKSLGITGKNGGTVYVYSTNKTDPTVIDESFGTDGTGEVEILLNNEITVSDKYNRTSDDAKNLTLTFHAYMAETVDDKTAADVFTTTFLNPGT